MISTGFPSLDRAMGGGLQPGSLVVLGGDDRAGTSALALAISLRCATQTLVLTSEMAAERVFERALAMCAGVSIEALRQGQLTEAERARVADAALIIRDRSLAIVALGSEGVAEVQRGCDGVPPPEMLVVDGLESLLTDGEGAVLQRASALAAAVLSLKRLAVARNVVVLCVSHLPALDRSRHDRRPRLSDFGACGAVGTHADVVWGLYREELYDADLAIAGAAELRVLKNRDGALAYVDLFFDARWIRFEDVLDA